MELKERKYMITQEQMEQIDFFKHMFDHHAEQIYDLCKKERDDVVYGFRLGEIYTRMKEHYSEMMQMENAIYDHEIKDEDE